VHKQIAKAQSFAHPKVKSAPVKASPASKAGGKGFALDLDDDDALDAEFKRQNG
jgi:hypothetical protein